MLELCREQFGRGRGVLCREGLEEAAGGLCRDGEDVAIGVECVCFAGRLEDVPAREEVLGKCGAAFEEEAEAVAFVADVERVFTEEFRGKRVVLYI